MSTIIQTTIFNVEQQKLVDAEVIIGIDAKTLHEVGDDWLEQRKAAMERAVKAGIQPPQHSHWSWGRKANSVTNLLSYKSFGIKSQEGYEGLALVETDSHRARLLPDTGKNLVYIEFIETAPHNVSSITKDIRYKLVGTRLMEAIIRYSFHLHYAGRIGLLALPQAECFYEQKIGMERGHQEGRQSLYYFELTPKQATKFLSE